MFKDIKNCLSLTVHVYKYLRMSKITEEVQKVYVCSNMQNTQTTVGRKCLQRALT